MRSLLVLASVLINLISFSQTGKITGVINDESSSTVIPFCNVILFDDSDSIINGTITTEQGVFEFKGVKYGTYFLSVQSLVHKDFNTDTFSISKTKTTKTFPSIKLTTAAVLADEVNISVERAAVKIEPAKKTFDVKATGADAGGTAVDVLNNLPSVNVDDAGNISLRGNTNIRVLIDGKPAGFSADDITAVINQLPANSIETIEIITVPSAKYDPEGVGGIINIVLKKEKKKGYQGSTSVNYSTLDKVNTRISLNINKKKWSINTSYNYTDGTYWNKKTSDGLFVLPDSITEFDNTRKSLRQNSNQSGKLNFNYKLNEKTKISVEGSCRQIITNNIDSSDFYWNYNEVRIEKNTRNAELEGKRLSANGQFTLNSQYQPNKSVSFLSRINAVKNPKNSYFKEPFLLQKENKSFGAQAFVNQLDFEFKVKNAKDDTVKGKFLIVETGLKSAHREFTEDYFFYEFNPATVNYEEQTNFRNNLDYGEAVYATYGLINFGNNTNKYSVGLRGELSNITSKTKDGVYNKTLLNLFPSVSFSHSFSDKKTLSISYSKRIKRPRGRQLNPIPTYSDPFNLFIGNANLVPEKSHMSEISYLNLGKKMVSNLTLFYQFRDDRLGRLSFIDSNAVSTVLWSNFNYHQTLGFELFANYKLTKKIKLNASSTFYNTWVDGENFREGYIAKYFGYDLKANLAFKLRKKTSLTWTGDYNSKRLAVVGLVLPRYGSDVSLKHKVLKNKGYLSLRFTDIFLSRAFGIDVRTDGWQRDVRYRYESQLLWFGFNYSFGQKKISGKIKFKRVSPNDSTF